MNTSSIVVLRTFAISCACCGDLKFPTKPVENLLFYLHRFSVGGYLPGKGSQPQK